MHPASPHGAGVVAGGGDEVQSPAARLGRLRREVFGEAQHDRRSGGVVECAFEVAVVVGDDHDVLVGRCRQRAPEIRALEALADLRGEVDVDLRGARLLDPPAHLVAVLETQGEGRHVGAVGGVELGGEIARNPESDENGRGPGLVGALRCPVPLRRMADDAGRRDAVEEDRLATHVATEKVGGGAESEPDGLEIEASLGRRRRALGGMGCREIDGRRLAGQRCAPGERKPLRR